MFRWLRKVFRRESKADQTFVLQPSFELARPDVEEQLKKALSDMWDQPVGGWPAHWRRRNRDAQRALDHAASDLAAVVLAALEGR